MDYVDIPARRAWLWSMHWGLRSFVTVNSVFDITKSDVSSMSPSITSEYVYEEDLILYGSSFKVFSTLIRRSLTSLSWMVFDLRYSGLSPKRKFPWLISSIRSCIFWVILFSFSERLIRVQSDLYFSDYSGSDYSFYDASIALLYFSFLKIIPQSDNPTLF
jgi:hypothetical protein